MIGSMVNIIGLISDTHGLLRPQAIDALKGSDVILHVGDICGPEVLYALRQIAPVVAVRGNNDRGDWARQLPDFEIVRAGDHALFMLHNLHDLTIDPAAAGCSAVISGHTHKPKIEEKRGVLWFNPGSAGPRRFQLPVTTGRLTVANGLLTPEIVNLEV